MTRTRTRLNGLGALIMSFAVACDGDRTPVGPRSTVRAREAVLSLATPHRDDGALLLTIRAPKLARIESVSSSHVVYSRILDSTHARVMVLGNLASGPLLAIRFSTQIDLRACTPTLEEAAARTNTARASLTEYTLTCEARP